jgi:hypothetical protein
VARHHPVPIVARRLAVLDSGTMKNYCKLPAALLSLPVGRLEKCKRRKLFSPLFARSFVLPPFSFFFNL